MRLATIIIICFGLCLQCFVQLGMLQWYEWNKATITQKHCVNKDKPQLQCKGKCYLKKQLRKAGQEQKKEKSSNQQQLAWVDFLVPEPLVMQRVYFPNVAPAPGMNHRIYSYVPFSPIFHPPRA